MRSHSQSLCSLRLCASHSHCWSLCSLDFALAFSVASLPRVLYFALTSYAQIWTKTSAYIHCAHSGTLTRSLRSLRLCARILSRFAPSGFVLRIRIVGRFAPSTLRSLRSLGFCTLHSHRTLGFGQKRAPTFAALISARRLGRFAPSGFALAFSVASFPQALCFVFALLVASLPRLCALRSLSRSLRSLWFCTLHSHRRLSFALECVAA